MFERYTQSARQILFFARVEAANRGSASIEPEHILFALLGEKDGLLRRLLDESTLAAIKEELQAAMPAGPPLDTLDRPLSGPTKRVLAFGANASEHLNHAHILPEHHLLGLLGEVDCTAARLLVKHGVTQQRVVRAMQSGPPNPDRETGPKPSRERLQELAGTLPEWAIPSACRMLEEWHAPSGPRLPPRIMQLRDQMTERFRQSLPPGTGAMGGSGGSWTSDAQGRVLQGQYSSSRVENGTQVTETHRFFEGHEITIIEGLRLDPGAKKLAYTQDVRGPKAEHQFQIDFDLS